MGKVKYIVQAFKLEGGELVPEPVLPFHIKRSAISTALRLSRSKDGVVAYAVDPATPAGRTEHHTLLLRIGKLPPEY